MQIKEEKSSKYTTQFIGKKGRVLRSVISNPAVYTIRGDEAYVRAKIVESNGKIAWTQPVFVKPVRTGKKLRTSETQASRLYSL